MLKALCVLRRKNEHILECNLCTVCMYVRTVLSGFKCKIRLILFCTVVKMMSQTIQENQRRKR